MDVTSLVAKQKKAWTRMRKLQGNPTCDLLRYTVSGADAARGIRGTRTLVAGLAGITVLPLDFSVEEVGASHGKVMSGDKRFVFYDLTGDSEPLLSDRIKYPISTKKEWDIKEVTGLMGARVEVHARLTVQNA